MNAPTPTSPRVYALEPVDAWYFGDARPYHAGESAQADARSLFPPNNPTLVGALRAALARANGWDGRSRWDSSKNQPLKLTDHLGFGYHELGPLSFRGPFLQVSKAGEQLTLYPVPLHLLGKEEPHPDDPDKTTWKPHAFLAPAEKPTLTDLGPVRLPDFASSKSDDKKAERGLKDGTDYWITAQGLSQVLAQKLPDVSQIYHLSSLRSFEPRVGLIRDIETRTTKTGALYSPTYVRLKQGVELLMAVDGLPNDWQSPEPLLPLGGESRLAGLRDAQFQAVELSANTVEKISSTGRLAITFLTPALLHDPDTTDAAQIAWPGPDESVPGLKDAGIENARVVSACLGKPIHIGGWDLIKKEPVPQSPYLPPGSTYFLDIPANQVSAETLQGLHHNRLGYRKGYGFGEVIISHW